MSAIELTLSTGTAYVHDTDYIADTISVSFTGQKSDSVPVPFLWTTETTEADVIAGIEAWIADPSITVDPNSTGLIVPTGVPTHPAAEITGQDCDNNLMQFRWINGPYNGDCATGFVMTTATTPEDLQAAVLAALGL